MHCRWRCRQRLYATAGDAEFCPPCIGSARVLTFLFCFFTAILVPKKKRKRKCGCLFRPKKMRFLLPKNKKKTKFGRPLLVIHIFHHNNWASCLPDTTITYCFSFEVIIRRRRTRLFRSRFQWCRADSDSARDVFVHRWRSALSRCTAAESTTSASWARRARSPTRRWTTVSASRDAQTAASIQMSSGGEHSLDDGSRNLRCGRVASGARETTTSLRHLFSTRRRSSRRRRLRHRATGCCKRTASTATAAAAAGSSVLRRPIGHHLAPCIRWFPGVRRLGLRRRHENLTNWQRQHRRRPRRRRLESAKNGTELSLHMT